MKVCFLFIEEAVSLIIEMDNIPRVGELVSIEHINKEDFESEKDYNNYLEEEIQYRQWRVEDIAWDPRSEGKTSVTVFLTENIKKKNPK